MPGWTNADNKFGPTPFVVGPVLGDGCNYTSIQSAINDASAVGGGLVLVRPGIYTENLTCVPRVYVKGAGMDSSDVAADTSGVYIDGSLNMVPIGVGVEFGLDNVTLASLVGPAIFESVFPPAITYKLYLNNCYIVAMDGASSAVNLDNAGGGSTGDVIARNCTFEGATAYTVTRGHPQKFVDCTFTGTINSMVWEGATLKTAEGCTFIAPLICSGSNTYLRNCQFESTGLVFSMNGANIYVTDSIINCSDLSGDFVDGLAGNFYYAGLSFIPGTSINLGASGFIPVPLDWKPYCESGAAPGTGVVRGTVAFDSAQFSVVDGFVQTIASGIFPWIDQPLSTGVPSNQGNLITAAGVTLTLPAAPAQGDTCAFKDPTGNAPYVIQANAGQQILIGNILSIVAGSATSSALGDSLELTFHAASNIWVANSVVGTFVIV